MLAKSALPSILWPPVPDPRAGHLFALQFQLQQSQWYSPGVLEGLQKKQLLEVLKHAIGSVPYYHQLFRSKGAGIDTDALLDNWEHIPLLSRSTLIEKKELLVSRSMPADHGNRSKTVTSGTTGNKVEVIISDLYKTLWNAVLLRNDLWHQRDFGGRMVSIRSGRYAKDPLEVKESDAWSEVYEHLYPTGPHTLFYHRMPLEEQARLIVDRDPEYLLAYPGNIQALLKYFEQHDLRLSSLQQVITMGECLTAETRHTCEQVWGATIKDIYGAEETGNIAFQCPDTENYHVQSEVVLVEVLDEAGKPCGPGKTGRVVLTTLHNFMMPLIRYDIGDYAEVGEACPCGRGLPVLKRICGRDRNKIRDPDGSSRWPQVGKSLWFDIPHVRQLQVIQKSLDRLEVRFVADQKPDPEHLHMLDRRLESIFGNSFTLEHVCLDEVPRHANGKFEWFICEVADKNGH